MSIGLRFSELEDIRLKNEIVPCGHNFDPIETSLTKAHIPHRGAPTLKVWALGLLPFGLYPGAIDFAKGSRGGTWHVPRGTWRHVTNAIVVPALWRIFWCLSRPDRTIRSGVIHESPWTDPPTHPPTHKQARPSCKNPPYPEEISIHQNGLTPILLHYDFELKAICFEPLVSRYISFVLMQFRLVMFIEAGDVTHRRRGQNRNEGLSKFFFTPKILLTQICLFWHNSARNDENNFFSEKSKF